MATLRDGQRSWALASDEEGYKDYRIRFLVETVVSPRASQEGPHAAWTAAGLPQRGDPWNFDGDYDPSCWCRAEGSCQPLWDDEPCNLFVVERRFSNKPYKSDRCSDMDVEDPILEPPRVSGGFVKYVKEAAFDRNGNRITTSAREQIRGALVEFDHNRPQIIIEQNVLDHQYALAARMVDTVNDAALWGLPARCIKLSDFSFESRVYGLCYRYYTRRLVFDVAAKLDQDGVTVISDHDRTLVDQGTICLRGAWNYDAGSTSFGEWVLDNGVDREVTSSTPASHLIRFQDWHGNLASVILNGEGRPWDPEPGGTGDDSPGTVDVEYYPESNFLLLGIPTSF